MSCYHKNKDYIIGIKENNFLLKEYFKLIEKYFKGNKGIVPLDTALNFETLGGEISYTEKGMPFIKNKMDLESLDYDFTFKKTNRFKFLGEIKKQTSKKLYMRLTGILTLCFDLFNESYLMKNIYFNEKFQKELNDKIINYYLEFILESNKNGYVDFILADPLCKKNILGPKCFETFSTKFYKTFFKELLKVKDLEFRFYICPILKNELNSYLDFKEYFFINTEKKCLEYMLGREDGAN